MIKRHHPLFVGERVFDYSTQYLYHITAINNDGTIEISMTDEDERESPLLFDCDPREQKCNNPNALYQFVPNLVGRDGNPICYEHDTEVGWCGEEHEPGVSYYSYYSPYLDENLFTFEVWSKEEWEKEFGTELA